MNLVILGFGYSARAFARRVASRFERIVGTARSPQGSQEAFEGLPPESFARNTARFSLPGGEEETPAGAKTLLRAFPGEEAALARDLAEADALLVSIPPGEGGDLVLAGFAGLIGSAPRLRWIGYLSTVGVYGDHGGAWVDEATTPRPASRRSHRRLGAEEAWLELGRRCGKAVQVFRLAGIYGPGRSAFDRLADGTARRIVKPGQVFNRIHVDDIAAVLEASLDRPRPGAVYNVADDEPAPPQDVVAYAAQLAGREPPPEIPFAKTDLSPMAASFYGESKRVANRLIREELGVALSYPTYREGLQALAPTSPGRSGPPTRTG